ncbi:MAG: hypothetical protein HYX79_03385 [Chloroflexi bacterium]|nr:hypothetical protein [Chloroflexota bacterium]
MKSPFFIIALSILLFLAASGCQKQPIRAAPSARPPSPASKPSASPTSPVPSQSEKTNRKPAVTPKPKAATNSTPAPSPPLSPEPPPDPAAVLLRLSSDVPEVYRRATRLMQKYPWWAYSFSDQTHANYWTISTGDKIWELRWKADSFSRAIAHLGAANSLARTGKLDTEEQPRNLSPQIAVWEILNACVQARYELDLQIKSTYARQEHFQRAIKSDVSLLIEGRYTEPATSEQKQYAITEMKKYFEIYRKDFSELVAGIESVIAYGSKVLPKG